MMGRKREKRKMTSGKRLNCRPCRFSLFVLLFSFASLAGCASDAKSGTTTRPATVRDRQAAALQDPMGYSPNMDSPDTDISGGKINELNGKAMRKDIDHVLNP